MAKKEEIKLEKPVLSQEFRDEYIKRISKKDFMTFPGLLALAKSDKLSGCPIKSINEADVIQTPNANNSFTAIVRAHVIDKDGNVWVGLGDASPKSCNKGVVDHAIRVAATRAKARALRDLLGIDMVCSEEINPFAPPELANAEQFTHIKQLIKGKRIGKAQAKQLMIDTTGCQNSKSLNFNEAIDFISALENLPDPQDESEQEEPNEQENDDEGNEE